MPRTVETRRSVTRSTHDDADYVKANLREVSSEIARVRDQARQEVDALERIRGMLSTESLSGIMETVEELETRLAEMEGESTGSRAELEAVRADLEKEQERLAKLWDAYKIQEDELERLKRDYPLMEEKLFERERLIENLRREVARLEPLAAYQDEAEAVAAENKRLAAEIEKLDHELDRASRAVDRLEGESRELRALEAEAGRTRDLEDQLEDERERLAKLYRVYEDGEGERKELQAQIDQWERWFSAMRPAFEKAGEAPRSAPHRD